MEFKKCSRCGNFYVSNGMVCPKCQPKDDFEYSNFKSFVAENGLGDSVDEISGKTGISVKNINRFIEYNNGNGGNGDIAGGLGGFESKAANNNDITFLI